MLYLFVLILPQTIGQRLRTLSVAGAGLEAEILFERRSVCASYRNVAGLHGDQFFVGFEIVVGRENASTDEFFLKDGDEIEKVFPGGCCLCCRACREE